MKKIHIVLVMILVSFTFAFAQQQKGDLQLQVQGTYFSQGSFNGGFVFFNASKFITQNIEVGASPIISISTKTTVDLSVYSNYNFISGNAKMVPYAGVQLLVKGIGDTASQTGFGLKGGIRYFITERVNVDVGPNITFLSGASLFYFNAGLGFILGRKG